MRFNYKRKTYPAVKIGDVFYVRDKDFLKSECYKENKRLKAKNEKLIKENEELKQKNKEAWLDYKDLRETLEQVTMKKCDLEKQLKHKNQLWKSAFRVYKKIKKKVENKLFPVEFLDVGRTIIPDMPDLKNNVVYKFSIPWQKVKEYILKKNKRGEK